MVTIDDVERAAEAIRDAVVRTPVGQLPGGLRLKREDLQRTGSFKLRGATNAVRALRPPAVVTGSSGNHGVAVATAARAAGVPATVVMTRDALAFKRARLVELGARVVECDGGASVRDALARRLAAETGAAYVSSHDDAHVIAGQGTVGLELAAEPALRTVLVPVGGGGLLAGVALAVRARCPGARVVGVEPQAADDFRRSLAAGHRVEIPPPATVCDGARVQRPGRLTFAIARVLVDRVVTVPDADVLAAVDVLAAAGIRAEPTGALAVAGALALGEADGAIAIVSGGNVAGAAEPATAPPAPVATLSRTPADGAATG